MKDSLNYFGGDQRIPEASSFKYLGIIISSDLLCADQVNYLVQKAWKANSERVLSISRTVLRKICLHVTSASDS